jgi:hypothetical protein
MSKHSKLAWVVYKPFVIQRLVRMFGYSREQAVTLVEDQVDVAEHALSIELGQRARVPAYIRSILSQSGPEAKVAMGVGAGLLGLGLIGLIVWLLKRK